MVRCPHCDHEHPATAQRCDNCGAWLTEAVEAAQSQSESPPGPSLSPAESEAIALLRDGKKLEAIKRYREVAGVGLAEAKAAVERLASQHRVLPQRTGCAGVLLLLAAAVGLAMAVW